MPEELKTPAVSRRPGFFREGWRELGRKIKRRKLRKQLQRQEQERNQALTQLGQRAWQENVDLSAHPDLRGQLEGLEGRVGALSAATRNLETEKARLEECRAAEVTKFDGQRKAVEEKKRPVDVALRAARDRQSLQEQAIKQLQARVATAAADRAALEQQFAALAASAAPEDKARLASAQDKRQQLAADQPQLSSELQAAQVALPGLAAEVNRLADESQRHAEELGRTEAERKAALSQTDAALERVRADLRGSQQQAAAVDQERAGRFAALGLALYHQKAAAAPLTDAMRQIAAIDQARAATQAALQASLAQSEVMPRKTMLKFSAAMLLGTSLMFAMGAGVYSELNPAQPSRNPERREGSVLAKTPKRQCEPLRIACDRLRRWTECVLPILGDIMGDIARAQMLLDAEFAGRSAPPEMAEVWRPQYLALKQELPVLLQYVANLQGEVATSAAIAQIDCAYLPGPEDQQLCQELAQRVQEARRKIREKLERDLDPNGPGMLPIRAILETYGAPWTSISDLRARLQGRLAQIQTCEQASAQGICGSCSQVGHLLLPGARELRPALDGGRDTSGLGANP